MHPIDLIDTQLLVLACPQNSAAVLVGWADPIKLGCQRFSIDGVKPIACLLAQASVESEGLTRLSENLNYSAERLAAVWPRRYSMPGSRPPVPNGLARSLAHNPEALANNVYANRMGNGPPESGDGWRYRGFGPFQLTGKDNQEAFGEAMGVPVDQVPAYLRTTNGGAMSMCWFFKTHGLDDLAVTPGCADETRAVNGGYNGLAERTARFNQIVAEMERRLA